MREGGREGGRRRGEESQEEVRMSGKKSTCTRGKLHVEDTIGGEGGGVREEERELDIHVHTYSM